MEWPGNVYYDVILLARIIRPFYIPKENSIIVYPLEFMV